MSLGIQYETRKIFTNGLPWAEKFITLGEVNQLGVNFSKMVKYSHLDK